MAVEINQELCAGCEVCLDVCPVGAIQLVDYRAAIDNTLCTQCKTCIDVCPNGAILADPIPVQSASLFEQPAAESHSVLIQDRSALPLPASPAHGLIPLAGAALAFLGREAAPRLVDVLVSALERKLTQPKTAALSPSSPTFLRYFNSQNRGKRKQARHRGGCSGYGNQRGRQR